MNIFIKLIFLLILTINCQGQENNYLASKSDLSFKVKLLTISRYGIESKESLLSKIENQKVYFLNSIDSKFIFFQVISIQDYVVKTVDGGPLETINNCSYYIAYSKERKKFYRVGGFEILDVSELFIDMSNDFYNYYLDESFNTKIDWSCLEKYNSLSNNKKKREKYRCYTDCSKLVNNTLIID